jgi:kinetochor protein Mis14/NSL1
MEDLAREEEDLLRSIAALKRRVPAATAAAFAASAKAGKAADEAALGAARARVEAEGAVSGRKALEGVSALDRQEELEKEFATTVETLGRLKREMPATVAKMERARVAAGYVATEF